MPARNLSSVEDGSGEQEDLSSVPGGITMPKRSQREDSVLSMSNDRAMQRFPKSNSNLFNLNLDPKLPNHSRLLWREKKILERQNVPWAFYAAEAERTCLPRVGR